MYPTEAHEIMALVNERDRYRAALEEISRDGRGLQGLIEDCASTSEIARYWEMQSSRRMRLAREALTETSK